MIGYIYSYVNDLGGVGDLTQLHNEIVAAGLGATFDGLRQDEDVVKAMFTSTLTAAEESTLSDTVNNYVYVYPA